MKLFNKLTQVTKRKAKKKKFQALVKTSNGSLQKVNIHAVDYKEAAEHFMTSIHITATIVEIYEIIED